MSAAGVETSLNPEVIDPFAGVDFSDLERSLRRPRTLMDFLLNGFVTCMTLFALIPLFSVVLMLVWRGGRKLSLTVFTHLPPAPLEQGGGFGNAIVGTLIMVALAVLISVPIGLLSAVYIAQARQSRIAEIVRFCAKVLTGFPSILAGVFAYGAIVLATGGYSEYTDRLDGTFADRNPGNLDRGHAGSRSSGRRNGASSVYRSFQQLLAVVARASTTDAADRFARGADL